MFIEKLLQKVLETTLYSDSHKYLVMSIFNKYLGWCLQNSMFSWTAKQNVTELLVMGK